MKNVNLDLVANAFHCIALKQKEGCDSFRIYLDLTKPLFTTNEKNQKDTLKNINNFIENFVLPKIDSTNAKTIKDIKNGYEFIIKSFEKAYKGKSFLGITIDKILYIFSIRYLGYEAQINQAKKQVNYFPE